jgi:transcription antitermination factor NusG
MLCTPINSHTRYVDDSCAWYVLYTRHQHEKTVAQILTSKGFEILLPLYSTPRRWKDRIKLVSSPLFPCYVFLKGGLERRLDIMTTPGVHTLVSSAGQPAPIPVDEIEAIRRVAESGAPAEPHPFLKCGDRMRVKCGPLVGIEGILMRKKNLYRLVLSVEMLGKSIAVEIDAFLVERLSSGYDQAPVPRDVRSRIARYTNDRDLPSAATVGLSRVAVSRDLL